MLPLQWVALGLGLVALDLRVDGWDLLANPLGWLAVLLGLTQVREEVGNGVVTAALVSLAVSTLAYPPGLLGDLDPAVAWALSLPQAVTVVVLAFALAGALSEHARELRVVGWLLAVVAAAPALVIGGRLGGLVGLVAFAAVAGLLYLVYLLLVCAPRLPGARAAG